MIQFFQSPRNTVLAVETAAEFQQENLSKLLWLFGGATLLAAQTLAGRYIGPRREMITPWSTNAVEITQNMGIEGISRIEEYRLMSSGKVTFDPMLQRMYDGLDQRIFTVDKKPAPIVLIDDIAACNVKEGLALSDEEVAYLNEVSRRINRKLTDSEVFGFSQVNSEHCRHKIFGGTFVIDGEEKEHSLFSLIKKTSAENPNRLVSAYKDNVAFNEGPSVEQFAPLESEGPSFYAVKEIDTVLSLKAETHNFPTTVEPFNGAATGTGGEIRDRLGGGKASLPVAGTAVYMTAYPRTGGAHEWERKHPPRPWLYQTPEQILIKASNGASDFGNKFGQPLICGSVLTFEHEENQKKYAYDKVIMLAGGIGYANRRDALKGEPQAGEKILVIGGDNYRIGMGGSSVSSVNTGQYASGIELNAVQRANPEMQKRAANVIRAIAESDDNPVVSIHDHGAGGHLNCLSELVESVGGHIDMSQLPVGDPTLSAREIIGNESQERMGLLVRGKDVERIRRIASRERAPICVAGETTGDMRLVFEQADGVKPIDIKLEDMFGKPPRTVMTDHSVEESLLPAVYDVDMPDWYLEDVLRLESVACKDWLTNKVDRSVSGRVARQQCQGELQLPLSDLGAVALDFRGKAGMATSIGHAPQVALIDPAAGSVMAIAEALTNIVFAPLTDRLSGVSLSANWMWPCRNEGEDARLYRAVEAASAFACALGINIPTGKDSLSMTQKYRKEKVLSPGTVIISAGAEVSDVKKIVSPVLVRDERTAIYHIDFSFDTLKLGGSAFAQTLNRLGNEAPTVKDAARFRNVFNAVQDAIDGGLILAGHDISAGGMITSLLEMCFASVNGGMDVNLDALTEPDIIRILYAENPGILVQVREQEAFESHMETAGVSFTLIARPASEQRLLVTKNGRQYRFGINVLRDIWYSSSQQLDAKQSGRNCAAERFANYTRQPVTFHYPAHFTGRLSDYGISPVRSGPSGIRAAVIREKGSQCERETAYALWLAGFDVKDVHMTDLATGRETLDEVNFIVFCGGFSNSDVLGSAKGWAGGILYNDRARQAIDRYYTRKDTLSMGICNGCQLMAELELLYPEHEKKHRMQHNNSHKFESAYISLEIPENHSVMFGSLSGSRLGTWVAHGEGKFAFPYEAEAYHIVARYGYREYPANPNGSPWAVAGICSHDGRHLALMPHPERAIFPWQCGYYPENRRDDEVTPWIEAFVNARKWVERLGDSSVDAIK
jgi:phosphoribosylformylglycinamidine synthase